MTGLVAVFAVSSVCFLWPRDPVAVFQSAITDLESGRLPEASRAARQLAGITQFERHAALLQGAILLREGKPGEALRKLSLTKPEGDLRPHVLRYTGETLYQLGRLTEAENVLTELVIEKPDDSRALAWLGYVFHDQGQMARATACLEDAVRLAPDDIRPRRLLGIIFFNILNYPDAAAQFTEVLRLDPGRRHLDIRQYLAHSLLRQRLYDEAIAVCNPVETDAFLQAVKAECLMAGGQPEQAWAASEAAFKIDPQLRPVVLARSRLLVERKQADEAIALLEDGLSRSPHDMELLTLLATAWGLKGDREQQKQAHDRLNQSSRIHEEYTALTEAANNAPRDAAVRDRLVQYAERIGEKPAAEFWKRSAAAARAAGPSAALPASSPPAGDAP